MELVLLMYNAHPYFSLKSLGKKVRHIHGKIWYLRNKMTELLNCEKVARFLV